MKRKIFNYLLRILANNGIFDIPKNVYPDLLTVLNYHRINDIGQKDFYSFKPNVSATRDDFLQQMEYVRDKYNVITCEQLISWVTGNGKLPPKAALITFDDGYYDNFANAYPVLEKMGLPAIIFLTTNFIGAGKPFYWDYVAYCFSSTQITDVSLPLFGHVKWSSSEERDVLMHNWIVELKKLPDTKKRDYVQEISGLLDVTVPEGIFTNLYLNWDQVRLMSQNNIEFGSHTASHPILTRIDLARVEQELKKSKERIEKEIEKPIKAFAYPNGLKADFSDDVIDIVHESGMKIAFTLLPGPTRYGTVRKNPFSIRRIYIGNKDNFPRFVAKLNGIARITDW